MGGLIAAISGDFMPAQRLTDKPVPVAKFDVLGEDSTSLPQFVCHVGLAIETHQQLCVGDQAAIRHMGPLENPGSLQAHSVGSASLTVDEANQIQLYLDEIECEYAAAPQRPSLRQQYVVHPHVKPWTAKDGTVLWLRFSCVGLVIESYREADIVLVTEEGLESVGPDLLDAAYPRLAPIQKLSPSVRTSLGIPGDGPWTVMLPGYVLHAQDRNEEDIRRTPYKPKGGDARFP